MLDTFRKLWYISMYMLTNTMKGQKMTSFFSIITILSAIMAVGAIEDCGGHCLGQENWTMFFVMFAITIVSAIATFYFQAKDIENNK